MKIEQVLDPASSVESVTVGHASRDYLTEREVDRLIEAAKDNRCGHRDVTAIPIAYRHGLRASELVASRWSDIELQTGRLHVRRAKGGTPSVHPISARESRALRRLQRESAASPYVFISERGAPLSAAGYQRMVARAGEAAGFGFLVHSQASTGMVDYQPADSHFQSIRFALYSAQELAGGIRAPYIVTVGDVDRGIPARGYVDDVKTRSTPPVI